MTRETKVGLIVAASFLCLVSIVVASKWRRGDAPTGAEEQSAQQVAAVKQTQGNAAKDAKKDGTAKDDKGPSLPSFPARPQAGDEKKSDKPDMLDVSKLQLVIPPPSAGPDPVKKELEQAIARNKPNNEPAPPKNEPLQVPGTLPSFPQFENKDPAPLVITPPGNVTDIKITPADPGKKPETALEFPAIKPPPGDDKKPAPLGALEIPPPVVDVGKPITKPDNNTAIPPLTGNDPIPAFPSIGKPATQETPKKDDFPGVAIVPQLKEDPKTPPVTLRPPNSIPRIGGDELPSTPLITPNTQSEKKSLLPVVKDVNNDFYECRPGETSMAIVSLKLYGSDKYADALLAYNRRHSSGIRNGEVFLFDRPSLSAGQQVLQPPLGILERDYGGLIRVGGTGSIPTIPSINTPVKIATPTHPGVGTSQPVASGRKYEVQNPAGESILDIAERALGDRGQWHRIWRINQQYQPQFRIPVGTKLDLPGS